VILPSLVVSWLLAAPPVTVAELRCEGRVDPLGIDAAPVRLSWQLRAPGRRDVRQTACEIRAAGRPEELANGTLWQSGKVASGQSVAVPWGGPALASRQIVCWQVRVWDEQGQPSAWSAPARFEMGLLQPPDWQARWINDGRETPTDPAAQYGDDPAPLFRREFAVPRQPVLARLYVTGLGYYEARLNGQRVGDHQLDPGWTNYAKRVLYSTYDVTEQIREGRNCLGLALGNGWYNPLPLRLWGHLNLREHLPVGRPRLIAQLELSHADGTRQVIASNLDWTVGEGPLRRNNIYLGEVHDARLEQPGWDQPGFADAAWRAPGLAAEPLGPLEAQAQPPIRVVDELGAATVRETLPGVYLFDLGRNFAGWATLRLRAPAGTRVTLRYGELLRPDGTLNPLTSVAGQIKGARRGTEESVGGPGAPLVAEQRDVYIARGDGEERYTPRFDFRAFRYVEVAGLPRPPTAADVSGLALCADVPRVGSFECSDALLNRIQALCDNTFRSNLFSVQSDCPHRERFGYGGDLVATSDAFMLNYDMSAFYAKAARDWADAARPDGTLTDTAPFVGIQYCGVPWAMAHPLLLRQLVQYYGDRALAVEQYDVALRWLDGVTARYPDHIVTAGLSDHEGLTPAPAPQMVTPLYAYSAGLLADLAELVGRPADVARYRRLQADITAAWRAKYVDANGLVSPGSQAAQAFGLWTGAVTPEQRPATFDRLVAAVGAAGNHLTTGILGTKFMLDELSRGGRAELAATIVRQTDRPGWGYMLAGGATTLWEHWAGSDNTFSHNHPMFGSVSAWFYRWLGGIQLADDAVAADRLVIAPQPVTGLGWVRCGWDGPRGPVRSSWRHEDGRFTLVLDLPPNTTASVRVPCDDPREVTEGGRPVTAGQGAPGLLVVSLGSGSYTFSAPLRQTEPAPDTSPRAGLPE